MKAKVDPDLCTGCGVCIAICPQVFQMDDDVAVAFDTVPADLEEDCIEASNQCPVEAIEIEK